MSGETRERKPTKMASERDREKYRSGKETDSLVDDEFRGEPAQSVCAIFLKLCLSLILGIVFGVVIDKGRGSYMCRRIFILSLFVLVIGGGVTPPYIFSLS